MTALEECVAALPEPNVRAFLRVIRAGESSQDDDAYRTIVGGGRFTSYDDHPRQLVHIASLGVNSTAAGAYQFLSRTWDGCVKALSLPDFSPPMQDIAAVYLIRGRGALADVLAGRVDAAIARCAREWASLPGSPYGQPTRTLAQALATYREYGGVQTAAGATIAPAQVDTPPPAPQTPPAGSIPVGESSDWPFPRPSETTMPLPAILGALLPTLIESIPRLGKIFGSGSAVAERNVKGAELAMQIAQQAIGATNAQEAVERVKADPGAAATATAAIEARWFELSEAGGGGIDGARKADAAITLSDGPWWTFLRSPSFWFLVLALPLVYLIVGSIVGLWGYADWSDDVRASLATAVVSLIIGGAAGYFWGQTTSRNRTPAPSQ